MRSSSRHCRSRWAVDLFSPVASAKSTSRRSRVLFDAIKRKRLTARCTVCADVEVRFIAEALTTADGRFPELSHVEIYCGVDAATCVRMSSDPDRLPGRVTSVIARFVAHQLRTIAQRNLLDDCFT